MSILVTTAHARTLLELIKKKIDAKEITSWSYDSDGDFSFEGIYPGRAWLRASVSEGQVKFIVLTAQGTAMAIATYALYHTKWLEILLEHFDDKFITATISALPSNGDNVSATTI